MTDITPETMSDDDLLAQINAHDPYDVEFARRYRALAARLAEQDATIEGLCARIHEGVTRLAEVSEERDGYRRLALIADTVARECRFWQGKAEAAETKIAHMAKAWGEDAIAVNELRAENARLRAADAFAMKGGA